MNLSAIPTQLATWIRNIGPIVGPVVAVVPGWVLSRPARRAVARRMSSQYIGRCGVEGAVVEIGLFGTRVRSTIGLCGFTNNKL